LPCRCYSCAWRAGWTGTNGKYNCDYLFWDNLYRACDYWYPTDASNRGSCKSTADTMYTTVRAVSQSYFTTDTCWDESWKLSNAGFCFNTVYTLTANTNHPSGRADVVTNGLKRPGNGQQWGTWANYGLVSR
jgi:hypothetical protein